MTVSEDKSFTNKINKTSANSTEDCILKWKRLQTIIQDAQSLSDGILKQQSNDIELLKMYFLKYYELKLDLRQKFSAINSLNNEEKIISKIELIPEKETENILQDLYTPIKNFLFLFRNNYDYTLKLISLFSEEENNITNEKQLNSLIELLCNQFYDNILISNPKQEELLLLIYKLIEAEVTQMNYAINDDFLENKSFLSKFIKTFINRQENKIYLSKILTPFILSIENEFDENINLSIFSLNNLYNDPNKIIENQEKKLKSNNDTEFDVENYLFQNIPKSKINESSSDNLNSNNDYSSDSDNDDAKNDLNNYNNDYKKKLTYETINKEIKKEKRGAKKDFYLRQLELITTGKENIYSNEKIINILKNINNRNIVEKYKTNFLFIHKKIDKILKIITTKVNIIPYRIRCLCKIIYILISKKFPDIPDILKNVCIGKLFFESYIFPFLSTADSFLIGKNKIISLHTQKCLYEIISVLSHAYKYLLFNNITNAEKTIFNNYIIEIIPTLNKFFLEIIDVKLPKVIEEIIPNKLNKKNFTRKNIPNRREKHTKSFRTVSRNKFNGQNNTYFNVNISILRKRKSVYEYYIENEDEILHLQCICFSISDLIFILSLINKHFSIFNGLPNYDLFYETFQLLHSKEKTLKSIDTNKLNTNKFFTIFKEKPCLKLEQLIRLRNENAPILIDNKNPELIFDSVKFSIIKILKKLIALDKKYYGYLNTATTNKEFLILLAKLVNDNDKLIRRQYNDYSKIPLNWYAKFLITNLNFLDNRYKSNDYEKLYEDIYKQKLRNYKELKNFSSYIISINGMNLSCAQKILEKEEFHLISLEKEEMLEKIKKFIRTEKIEVCLSLDHNKKNDDIPSLNIKDGSCCIHRKLNTQSNKNITKNVSNNIRSNINNKNTTNNEFQSHIHFIEDFINIFSNNKNSFSEYLRSHIILGESTHSISDSIIKYMSIVDKKIKNPIININLFDNKDKNSIQNIYEIIKDYILEKIYKFVYPKNPLEKDKIFYERTKILDWITPYHLEIKKKYINQLNLINPNFAELDMAKSVTEKIEFISYIHSNINKIIKFSGNDGDAGQDEITPIFQYLIIKAQPKRFFSNIDFIKYFLDNADLRGKKGFFISQMETASTFILNINSDCLKISQDDFDKNVQEAKTRHLKNKNKKID